jgi:hypothetical protein
VTCIHVEALPEGTEPEVKAKSTIQWVSPSTCIPIEVRNYQPLFLVEEVPDATWEEVLNPKSEVCIVKYSICIYVYFVYEYVWMDVM